MRKRHRNCKRIVLLVERILKGTTDASQLDRLDSRVFLACDRVEAWAQIMLDLGDPQAAEDIVYAQRVRRLVQERTHEWRECDMILAGTQA
jgi:hypothetical protein